MDKKQLKLQVMHNQFMRLTIVSMCKIFLWSIACYFSIVVINWGAASAATKVVAESKKAAQDAEAIAVLIGFCTFLVSVVYLVIVISMVAKIIAKHKVVVSAEAEAGYENI